MLRITFKYRDQYTRGGWSQTTGEFETVAECIKFYGLGIDCEYEIISIEEVE